MNKTDELTDQEKAAQRAFLAEFDRDWLAHRMRDLRDIMELRQEEVADYLGIKRSSLGHMESVADYARVSATAQIMGDMAKLAGLSTQVVLDKRISLDELRSLIYDVNDRFTGERRSPPFLQIVEERKKRRQLERERRKAQQEANQDEDSNVVSIVHLREQWKEASTLMPFNQFRDEFAKANPEIKILIPVSGLASLGNTVEAKVVEGAKVELRTVDAVQDNPGKTSSEELTLEKRPPPCRPWYPGAPENLKDWINETKLFSLKTPGSQTDGPDEKTPAGFSRRFWDSVKFEIDLAEEKGHTVFDRRLGPSPIEIRVDVRSTRWVMALGWAAPSVDEGFFNQAGLEHSIMKLTVADRLSKQNYSKAIILYDMTSLRHARTSLFFDELSEEDQWELSQRDDFSIDECLAHHRALARSLNINVFTVTQPKEAAELILKLLKNQLTKEQIQDMTGGILLPTDLGGDEAESTSAAKGQTSDD